MPGTTSRYDRLVRAQHRDSAKLSISLCLYRTGHISRFSVPCTLPRYSHAHPPIDSFLAHLSYQTDRIASDTQATPTVE